MARRRMLNTVRTDYLEGKMAHYHAIGWHEAEHALGLLAAYIGAPIDEAVIAEEAQRRRAFYEEPTEGK